MKWYLKVLRQYADFGGRARWKDLARIIAFVTVILMLAFPVKASGANTAAGESAIVGIMGLISLIILIIVCVKNAQNAKKRSKNHVWAVIYTVLLTVVGLFVGSAISVATNSASIILTGILVWVFALLGTGIAFLIAKPASE
jgi:uncharacterized membrane protein YhaH (DUF805 family)